MKRINVTEPYLPPFEEYVEKLKGIWALPGILEAFLVDGRALVGPLVRSA